MEMIRIKSVDEARNLVNAEGFSVSLEHFCSVTRERPQPGYRYLIETDSRGRITSAIRCK